MKKARKERLVLEITTDGELLRAQWFNERLDLLLQTVEDESAYPASALPTTTTRSLVILLNSVQDIVIEGIRVYEETCAHAPDRKKRHWYRHARAAEQQRQHG